jgi:hypothetical protein
MAIPGMTWYAVRPVGRCVVRAVVALAMLAVVGGAGCDRAAPPVPRKTTLVRAPRDYALGSASVSEDLSRVAYPRRGESGYHVINEGTTGPPWDTIHIRSFAPGTRRLFYWATSGERSVLVADGQEIPIGRSRHDYLVFDAAGTHWAVVAAAPNPASPDERIEIIVDGVVRGRHRDASVPAVSSDGAHVAWIALEAADEDRTQMRLLVDGAVRRAADVTPGPCISPLQPAGDAAVLPAEARALYLSDGRLVALMREGEGWVVLRDGEPLARFAMNLPRQIGVPVFAVDSEVCREAATIVAGSVVTAKDAPVVAWWERAAGPDGQWRVVLDGKAADATTCVRPWEAQPPAISLDGRAVAYPCYTRYDDRGQDVHVVLGDHRYGPYTEVYGVAISDDGRHVAWAATDEPSGRWTVYRDGVPYRSSYYSVWRPRFDPSGEHLAWEAKHEIDQFGVLVLDGRDVGTFEELLDGPMFLQDGYVSWAVGRAHKFARVTLPLRPRR